MESRDPITKIKKRVMQTSVLRALVNNPVKKSFYGERKKTINVLTVFFSFFIKVMSKLF